ncbi:uncharacterized protein LOC9303288 isoform X1 [Arabidopsis lyrata subsp. lyrata]|uniref:uncharacterized protein LOC9303288 isoform X1 n=1 Tax=Arabidopsis lyrata subsp. lyrata TaxID=81972 RepID=UPI000A29A5F6|nr:uncharacterized protein LOC9303288 isoform X1 [Arabidopsis lyrata subsp. lyrata]|eukprot:XP_020874409.1 uncharacterized protein LOC9303288 isoform X1 [Arabidopsis lyrata subsp. lyrata]
MEEDKAVLTGAVATRVTMEPSEDILICVDVDAESTVEMKTTGTNGKPLNRLECVKLAITRFIHDKLARNSDHRFAFATLSKSAAWLKKEFTSDAESAAASLREISATNSSGPADLTLLFQEAAQGAKTSRAQNRILRVILIYCRSSVRPTHDWPINQKLFTLDVMYLHDKSAPDNCTHDVYDSLVDALERVSEYEGYIFESSHGLAQSVFRRMSTLLSHPPQRCAQVDLPKPSAKKPAVSCDQSTSGSKKGAKQPLEKTSNTNTKRVHSLGKENASDLKNYDENLVGSRVKIWWPLDRAYYEAVVISYYSAKARHRVRYIDGDEEILNMRKEKWYFVNESKLPKQDKEANQTGCVEEASTMPQKKKAKTSKEQSVNKQSKMLSPFPLYVKKDDEVIHGEVPQISRRQAEQVLSSCASQLKKYLTEAVKSSSVPLDKHSDVVDSICEGAFDALKQEEVVANEKEDRQGPREAAVKEQQKAAEVSTPELTFVPERKLNLEHSLSFCPHDSSVNPAISSMNENGRKDLSPRHETVAEGGVKTQERKILEMVQQPVAEEEDLAETETQTHKRARVESSSLGKADGEMEKKAAEGEPSCRSQKSSAEPGDSQRKNLPEPCSVTQQLAKVKQSILDTVASVRQFRCELERKEQSIVDTLSIVRLFRSEIEEKEDILEASLLEIDVLGEKISGINKILN